MSTSKKVILIFCMFVVIGITIYIHSACSTQNQEWVGETMEKISYSDVSENDYLDLYLPESDVSLPLLILVHGGGFFTGDSHSKETEYMLEYFKNHGYACASINYRLSDEATYPAAIEDVKEAVYFLHDHAKEYGLDEERFFIWGESAGAYLATMATVSGDDISVKALVDFYGPMDFYSFDEQYNDLGLPVFIRKLIGNSSDGYTNTEDSPESIFMGQSLSTLSAEQKEEMSPESYIAEFATDHPDFKVYICHGKLDITVPYVQSINLADSFASALGEYAVDFVLHDTYKHADKRFYSETNLDNVLDFLNNIE